ncbi:putative pentatricopeptide repeat-containing protein [Acorus calamus]|uniref:Pentatricopeptide repeat-containing protein n=2 Tax=Acorus calamus TaxID=4465 RepID=A0AAV9F5W0_ACOCL|nr:putative pentatricopeptide repeat-containing protein [Acorus calamus]
MGSARMHLRLFSEMVEAGIAPDGITFVAVLSACSHAGLVIEDRRLFDRMVEEFNVMPSMEHYACMVDLLGRAGLLREANEVVERMPVMPNECVWGALLNSSRIHKNASVAEEVATRIFELDVEKKRAGSYMLLSNVYASCGRWDDSARVRDVAMTNGIRKSPGWSWIELNERVFTFMSGEDLPSCMEDVYWMLELLNWGMDGEAPINGGGIFNPG